MTNVPCDSCSFWLEYAYNLYSTLKKLINTTCNMITKLINIKFKDKDVLRTVIIVKLFKCKISNNNLIIGLIIK